VAHQRGAQPVRVEVGADAAGAARAEPTAGQRIVRVAGDLPEPAVAHMGQCVALPEADVAERRDDARFAGGRPARHGSQAAARARAYSCGARAEAAIFRKRRREMRFMAAVRRYELEKSNIC